MSRARNIANADTTHAPLASPTFTGTTTSAGLRLSGGAIEQNDGTDLLTEAGVLDNVTLGSSVAGDHVGGAITWRVNKELGAGDHSTVGSGGSDWEIPINDSLQTDSTVGSGTLVTESSGIFSFESTGYYLIMAQAWWDFLADTTEQSSYITIDGSLAGASYVGLSRGFGGSSGNYNNGREGANCHTLIKVSTVATDKIKLSFSTAPTSTTLKLQGGTTTSFTAMTFIKLSS